jgi:hypothetical protein
MHLSEFAEGAPLPRLHLLMPTTVFFVRLSKRGKREIDFSEGNYLSLLNRMCALVK